MRRLGLRLGSLVSLGLLAACVPAEEVDSDGGVDACGSRGLAACDRGDFCNFPETAACGEADLPGVCQAPPQVCAQVSAPVCGCDGRTYENDCEAASASVSVRRSGACEQPDAGAQSDAGPALCGGFAGLQCPSGLYCSFEPATRCGSGDQTGTCSTRPEVCSQQYSPMCGCDGKTYGNSCLAALAGVSVAADGPCEEE